MTFYQSERQTFMDAHKEALNQFLSLSVILTGFDQTELLGTGMAQEYYHQVVSAIGEDISQTLWSIAQTLTERTGTDLDAAIRRELMASPKFGPIARNIIQLWYWGSWIELPQDWRYQYGTSQQDMTRFTSPEAYQEGLIWKAMSTHPEGAKQPGFGSWGMLPGNTRYAKNRGG
jgi:hypothetical protein